MHAGVYLALLVVAGLAFSGSEAFGQAKNRDFFLGRYHWQKRVILVFMPANANSIGLDQLKLLQVNATALTDRDLVVLEVTGELVVGENVTSANGNQLRRQFKVSPGTFTLVLIGKDGGEKYRSLQLTPPAKLFSIIDAMPMRQNEINSQKKQKQ